MCLFIDLYRYSRSIFSVSTGLISSTKVSTKAILTYCRMGVKVPWFYSCFKILRVQIFQKIHINHESSQLWKWCFSVNTGLFFFMRFTITYLTPRKWGLFGISGSWSLHQARTVPKIERCFYWLMSKVKLLSFCNYRLNFFQQGPNQKPETC